MQELVRLRKLTAFFVEEVEYDEGESMVAPVTMSRRERKRNLNTRPHLLCYRKPPSDLSSTAWSPREISAKRREIANAEYETGDMLHESLILLVRSWSDAYLISSFHGSSRVKVDP